MYAEVMNELAGANGNYQGDAGMTALQALAMVHNRGVKESNNDTSIEGDFLQAAANHNKEQFLNDIAQENAWELTGECARKWDLVRWGMLASKIAEAKAEYAQKCLEWPTTIYFNYTDATKLASTRVQSHGMVWKMERPRLTMITKLQVVVLKTKRKETSLTLSILKPEDHQCRSCRYKYRWYIRNT